ncbi:hypothetical protein [Belliella pelovolcani]|uniref:Uncharacterized protein n=1 Tax=Belliella pelovolcani TaxID=529505 RepID=A0A1N7P6R2_9BACT|nr:hypothetical protein [Belliella pelovolcani]SIT06273.1 hypothetical protein SAMN05421761_11464 [Belliella pelovolcani]
MAKEDKRIDELFRNKLANHEVKPSALAWEKLESQLPQKKGGVYFPLMRIAASILVLLGLAYLGWFLSNDLVQEDIPVAFNESVPSFNQESENSVDVDNKQVEEAFKDDSENQSQSQVKKTSSNPSPKATAVNVDVSKKQETVQKQELVAEVKNEMEKSTELLDLPELKLPELKIEEAIAEAKIDDTQEEVSYTITIRGSGIKEAEPAKQGLIDEIEEKVEKIGGFLNKVDQGFAELQDAKNNLFATITTRKERSK